MCKIVLRIILGLHALLGALTYTQTLQNLVIKGIFLNRSWSRCFFIDLIGTADWIDAAHAHVGPQAAARNRLSVNLPLRTCTQLV